MRILLTFESFVGFAGTETYTLAVAKAFERFGHDVLIYSPNRGPMAEHARKQGIRVVGAYDLPATSDLVIFCDTATCHDLAGRYTDAVRIFVAHGSDFLLVAPPQIADRSDLIVTLNDRVRRAIEARAWRPRVVRLRQPIDILRFRSLGPPRSPARRVLVVSNAVKGQRAAMIEEACRATKLELDWIGTTSTSTASPEFALADTDIVIGLGRCVLEAMAAGRAAYVYGVAGGDGWVTPESYHAIEADGFGGTASPEVVVDGSQLIDDLRDWDVGMGEVNRDLATAHHNARDHAIDLINLAREIDPSPPSAVPPDGELAHLVRLEMQNYHRIQAGLNEADRLRMALAQRSDEVDHLRGAVAGLEHEIAALRVRLATAEDQARSGHELLESLRATRRYRLATTIAAPLDRLRGHITR